MSSSKKNIPIILAVVGLACSIFLTFQPFVVSGASMQPTLLHGDIVLVERVTHYVWIQRGDVLVFRNPHDKGHITVKRVIGLPNEEVRILTAGVSVFDEYGDEHHFGEETTVGGEYNGSYFSMNLGSEDYMVLGDNRSASSDSREFGAVQKSDMIGKVIMCLWPRGCNERFKSGKIDE